MNTMNTMNTMNSVNTIKAYRYKLDPGPKKFPCPGCGQKRFVKYLDSLTKEYLADQYGRCDRENHCGYHLRPEGEKPPQVNTAPEITQRPINYLPLSLVEKSMNKAHWQHNNLFIYLKELFGEAITTDLFLKYLIGTSKHEGSTVFWQIDEQEKVRQGKIVPYNPHTGKRIKDAANTIRFVGKMILGKESNFNLCFFGQHLLAEYPIKKVCITESEKTAIIGSIFFPDYNWLATGGASGCKWREYSVFKCLQRRKVTFFPDHGYYNHKTKKTCYEEWSERVAYFTKIIPGSFIVSDVLERKLRDEERDDQDLADILVRKDEQFNCALTEDDYPVMFDTKEIVENPPLTDKD